MKKNLERMATEQDTEIVRLQTVIRSMLRRNRIYHIGNDRTDKLRFAVIGDTHIGSMYERVDALTEFYKLLKKEGITTVLHCGDMIDGHNMYRGHEYELYAYGFQNQVSNVVKKYPKIDGIETYFILGTHDNSFKKAAGVDVGKEIQARRSDLHYLDDEVATVIMRTKSGKNIRFQLIHPGGGTAYAVSYKSQKIVESYSGGNKPHAVFIGHYHKADHMPCFRNVQAIQSGCFQSQTPFMAKQATPAHIGGWIIEECFGKNANRFKAEFIAFYEHNLVNRVIEGNKNHHQIPNLIKRKSI